MSRNAPPDTYLNLTIRKVHEMNIDESKSRGKSGLPNRGASEAEHQHTSSRCKICTHDKRGEMEVITLGGTSLSQSALRISDEFDIRVTEKQLEKHMATHLDPDVVARLALLMDEANDDEGSALKPRGWQCGRRRMASAMSSGQKRRLARGCRRTRARSQRCASVN